MATHQIPKAEWPHFFDAFSNTHTGKKASAEIYGQGIFGSNEEVKLLPFEGITYEEKGSDAHSVRIMLGDLAKDHISHEVPSPTQVWSRPKGDDGGEMLEIHGSDEQRLILKVHD